MKCAFIRIKQQQYQNREKKLSLCFTHTTSTPNTPIKRVCGTNTFGLFSSPSLFPFFYQYLSHSPFLACFVHSFCVVCKFDKFIGYIISLYIYINIYIWLCAEVRSIYGAAMWMSNTYFRLVFFYKFCSSGFSWSCVYVNVCECELQWFTFGHICTLYSLIFFFHRSLLYRAMRWVLIYFPKMQLPFAVRIADVPSSHCEKWKEKCRVNKRCKWVSNLRIEKKATPTAAHPHSNSSEAKAKNWISYMYLGKFDGGKNNFKPSF